MENDGKLFFEMTQITYISPWGKFGDCRDLRPKLTIAKAPTDALWGYMMKSTAKNRVAHCCLCAFQLESNPIYEDAGLEEAND